MIKFKYKQDFKDHKKDDIVEMKNDFWSKYYQIKGIIQPVKQLEVQTPFRRSKKGKKKNERILEND